MRKFLLYWTPNLALGFLATRARKRNTTVYIIISSNWPPGAVLPDVGGSGPAWLVPGRRVARPTDGSCTRMTTGLWRFSKRKENISPIKFYVDYMLKLCCFSYSDQRSYFHSQRFTPDKGAWRHEHLSVSGLWAWWDQGLWSHEGHLFQ